MSSRRPRIAGERRRPTDPAETAPADATPSSPADATPSSPADATPSSPADATPSPPADATPSPLVEATESIETPRPSRPPMSRRARVLLAALGVLAVVAVVFAVVATAAVEQTESSADERVATEDAATAAATPALETVLSYGHETVAEDLKSATELMTDDFAAEYEQLSPQVASAAEQRKIDVAATVRAIAPLECGQECSDTSVRLLAFVDQNRTVAGKAGSPAALSVVVRMEKVDGDWLVAELTTT
ncbi:hypothetical protein FE697_013860 [Mumia zhuanghuii]|uniref:Mce-associated membrane protein n=2 Tax=Mumia TaxID=1546255 RepID=A0ABW1QN93_9ACTN|nr:MULTISPECIES: hypothetical protein [Mumia]KAA1422245.1 hypothetical protein FE697_013860 [Mumia zhuanghuii]